jgi:hypothetical protein
LVEQVAVSREVGVVTRFRVLGQDVVELGDEFGAEY